MEVSMIRSTWVALCVTVLVMSGMSLAKSVGNKEAVKPSFKCSITMDITNKIYNNSLLNNASAQYKLLCTQVKSAFYAIYGCPTCDMHATYQGVSAMTFSNQSGTVLVKTTLVFGTTEINAVVIKSLFQKAFSDGKEVNGIKINPKFTQTTSESVPTTTTTAASTTRPTTTTTTPTTTTSTTPTTTPTTTTTTTPTTTTTTTPTTTTSTTPTTTPTTTTTTTPTTTTTTTPTTTTTTTPTTTPTTTTTTTPTTTTTTIRPTTTTTTTTRPTTAKTTKHHNAASSFFHQSPMTLTSFLRFCVSFCLFFFISSSF